MRGALKAALKATSCKRRKAESPGRRPLERAKSTESGRERLSVRQHGEKQENQRAPEHSSRSRSVEEELSSASDTEGAAAAAATAAAATAEGSSDSDVSSADSSAELRCSSDSEAESEEGGTYDEELEGPPGQEELLGDHSDGFQEALGAQLKHKHPDFLDFVLSAAGSGDGEEDADMSGSEEASSAAESEEEAATSTLHQRRQQQDPKRRLLTQERFLAICSAIGIDPLAKCKKEAEARLQQAQEALRSLRGAQLLLEALHAAVMQLFPKQDEANAAGAMAVAAARAAGERSKFKHAKQHQDNEEGLRQQQQRNEAVLRRLQQQQQQHQRSSRSSGTFELPDGDTCSFVILAVVRSAATLFKNLSSRESPEARRAAEGGGGLPEVASSRLRRLLKGFGADITHLLLATRQQTAAAAGAKELMLQVLLALSRKDLLQWIMTQEAAARRLLQAVCRYWAFSQQQQQQLAAFAVLRSALLLQQSAAAAVTADGKRKARKGGEGLPPSAAAIAAAHKEQQFLQQLLRSYQRAAARLSLRRTWRAASRMQLLLNETKELLSLAAPPTVYRIAYQSVRELALTVRSALAAGGTVAKSASKPTQGLKSKAAHRKKHRLEQAQLVLFCWPFVATCALWASCLDLHKEELLRPLLFPLVSVAAAAVKLYQQQLSCSPFCLNLLDAIARAGVAADALVPIAAPLLAVLQLLLQQHAAVCRRSSSAVGAAGSAAAAAGSVQKKGKKVATTKAADNATTPLRLQQAAAAHVDTCLKIDSAQQESLHQFGASKKLQQVAAAASASAETVKRLRLSLRDMPIGRVAVLPIEQEKQHLPLLALSERLTRERQRAMAEGVKDEVSAAEHRKKKEVEETFTAKQLKRRRQKEQRQGNRASFPSESPTAIALLIEPLTARNAAAYLAVTAAAPPLPDLPPTVPEPCVGAAQDVLEEFDSDLSTE
ncbi:uncharacterized protein LOC34624060 [Cyclospora cayetanensis]|uniref:Uncharacterized protein LOC34624060 n=1 Tax=Cyclospora cayetanensis TaxID=88456 RepID=A0A6P6S005_9EIME|nr:uncharacterized protein LOC34624060 [Cyclospora cayetanensis]